MCARGLCGKPTYLEISSGLGSKKIALFVITWRKNLWTTFAGNEFVGNMTLLCLTYSFFLLASNKCKC